MKKLFQIGLLLLLATPVVAQESSTPKEKVLRTYDWKNLPLPSTNCQIVSMDGMSVLKVENTNNSPEVLGRFGDYPADRPWQISLLKITNSSVLKKTYWISCEIKYENVWNGFVVNTNREVRQRSGILKLLTYFPPAALGGDERIHEGHYDLSGTSNWQPYHFVVDQTEHEKLPTQLELKLSFAGNGTVYLRAVKLYGYASSSNWWTPEQAGRIGGIGGAIIGCLGGLIGILASKGKARNFVLATIKIFIALGIILLIAGVVAIALRQPYNVWYALLLPGFILTLVFSLNLPSIQRRYDELEIRRMTSEDAMRS